MSVVRCDLAFWQHVLDRSSTHLKCVNPTGIVGDYERGKKAGLAIAIDLLNEMTGEADYQAEAVYYRPMWAIGNAMERLESLMAGIDTD